MGGKGGKEKGRDEKKEGTGGGSGIRVVWEKEGEGGKMGGWRDMKQEM